jgi:hypothetical protein
MSAANRILTDLSGTTCLLNPTMNKPNMTKFSNEDNICANEEKSGINGRNIPEKSAMKKFTAIITKEPLSSK